jgi:hypothetical protein
VARGFPSFVLPPPLPFANYSESAASRVFVRKTLGIKGLGLIRMSRPLLRLLHDVRVAKVRKERCHTAAVEQTEESSGMCPFRPTGARLKFRRIMPTTNTDCQGHNATGAPLAGRAILLEPQNQPATGLVQDVTEARRKPRYKLVVDISIHSQSCGLLKARTLDISEIGIGAVLGEDVPVGEVVKLDIPLPSGPVAISATVRQRSSLFRYGFEFMEANPFREILQSTCHDLATQQSASVRP